MNTDEPITRYRVIGLNRHRYLSRNEAFCRACFAADRMLNVRWALLFSICKFGGAAMGIYRNHYPMLSHKAEGVWCLVSGPCETGVEPESPGRGSRCVLKQDTTSPWLPDRSIVTGSPILGLIRIKWDISEY